jgi:hypothetical protein
MNHCKIDYEIIIAEDGSTDHTVDIAREYSTLNSKVIVNSSKQKLGKGRSIVNAMAIATKDIIMYIDVDLASDISEIERMSPYLGSNDIVIGSRLIRENLDKVDRPFFRRLFSECYSFLCQTLFMSSIKDYQCGLKMMRKNSALINEVIPKIKSNKFAFDTDLLVHSKIHGLKVKEVAVRWEHKDYSKVNVSKQIWCMGADLFRIWLSVQIEKLQIQKEKFNFNSIQMNLR